MGRRICRSAGAGRYYGKSCRLSYLVREVNPEDKRSQLLYATEQAESLKNPKAHIETVFYEWLLEDLPKAEKETFCATLDKLYWKSKEERRAGFTKIAKRLAEEEGEKDA